MNIPKSSIHRYLMPVLTLLSMLPSVAQADWKFPAVTISSGSVTPTIATNPKVTIDSNGNGVAHWMEYDGENTHSCASTLLLGNSWSIPQTLSSFKGKLADHINMVAVDPLGNAVAVWQEQDDKFKKLIKTSTLAFESLLWTASTDLSDRGTTSIKSAQLAVDFTGNNIFAAWTDAIKGNIQLAPFLGGNWSSPAINCPLSSNSSNAKIAVDRSGNAVAIWEESINGHIFISGATLPVGTDTWIPFDEPISGPGASAPQVAMHSESWGVAIWISEAGTIQAAILPVNKEKKRRMPVLFPRAGDTLIKDSSKPFDNLSAQGVIGKEPQIAIDLVGNIVAIWTGITDAGSIIQSAILPLKAENNKWLPRVNLSGEKENASSPKLAMDGFGNAIAVWQRTISDRETIVASAEFNIASNQWLPSVDLSAAGEKSMAPEVSVNPYGKVVVVWENSTTGVIQSISQTLVQRITNITPNAGLLTGGNEVTISGTNFMEISAVKFGENDADNFKVDSLTKITAIAPAGSMPSAVDVTITGSAGTSLISLNSNYSYLDSNFIFAQPVVSSINPVCGVASGETTVTLHGSGFTGATAVQFGTVNAISFVVNSDTQITAVSPPVSSNANPVNISVTTPGGTSEAGPGNLFTYFPVVRSVSPTSGPASGGNSVTIMGNAFIGATSVLFSGINALSFVINSETQITAVVPPSSTCSEIAQVEVFNSCNVFNGFVTYTYIPSAPTVTGLNPSAGTSAGGTSVVIQGTGFIDVTAVQFGGVNATSFVRNSAFQITAVAPMGTPCDVVDVTVTSCGFTSTISPADEYTYTNGGAAPTVTNLSPNSGSSAGSTPVTITGTDFAAPSTVSFGGVPATGVTVVNPTTITATSPAAAPNSTCKVDVLVTSCGQTSAPNPPADEFTYTFPTPTVTGLSPSAGSPSGGTLVTITGTDFHNTDATTPPTVSFGGVPGTGVTVVNSTTITVTSPAADPNSPCAVDVTVTSCGQTSPVNPSDEFTYTFPAPTVTGLSPSSGSSSGGTLVTITGTNFHNTDATTPATVSFGSVPGTGVTVVNSTTITVTSPAADPNSPCAVDVTVTSCGQTSPVNPSDEFTYTFPAPTVTGLSPSSGSSSGGTLVTITGTNFHNTDATTPATVSFGGVPGTGVTVVNSTTITVTSPAAAPNSPCTVDVIVSSCGQSSNSLPFTYNFPAPTILSLNPNSGPVGQSVTINGSNFHPSSTVNFGATAATNVVVVNETTITTIAPETMSCVVDVTVDSCGQTSNAVTFTYASLAVPTVTGVSPTFGPASGGNSIQISGTGFMRPADVKFGVQDALNSTVNSPTSITAIAPAGTNCQTVDITVSGCSGTSPITVADEYTYKTAITLTSINPNSGSESGGNAVIITGTNLDSVTIIQFGSNNASFVINSPTQITAIAPAGSPGTVIVTVTNCAGSATIQYTYLSNAPSPPRNFIGCIKKNEFLNRTECILEATWSASLSPNIVSYRIYKNNKMIATIKAKSRFSFSKSLSKCTAKGFSITAVNQEEQESSHVKLKIL